MNNILLWVVGAIVVLGGGFFIFQNSTAAPAEDAMVKEEGEIMQKDDVVTKADDSMAKKDDAMMEKDEGAMMQKGSYEAYASEKLAKANSGDVVLFFRASWCPTCKAVDSDIRARLSAIPQTLTILDVDYDNSAALKQKYGVTYQHTFVQVKADGTLIKKWSGSPTLAALVAEVQ
ncbi:thioredoxin [Candidatus Kaiserbacteria bacterium]|nr:thioredoxin [Candidatus Kaiserbacteria bacterium]